MADNKENSEDNGRATQPAQPKPLIPPPSLVTPLAPSLATPIQSIPTPPPPPAVSMQVTKAPVKPLAPSAPSLKQGQPLQAGVQTIQSPRSTQSFVNQRVQTTQLPYQTNQQQLPYQTNQLPYQTNQLHYQTNQQYQQQPQRSSVSGIRAGAVGFSLLAGLFPLPFNPLFLPIQMTIFIIMIIILLFKGWDFWTAALLAWLIPGLIAAVLHYMIIGGVLSVMGMGEGEATN